MEWNPAGAGACLRGLLEGRVEPAALGWLDERCRALASGGPERHFFLAFSSAPRRVGRAPLALEPREAEAAWKVRPGWQPGRWTCDDAARILLVLACPHGDAGGFVAVLDKAFASAELGELVALYRGLPVLPHAGAHVARCAEGVRTNMTRVFAAVAHHNPYPCEHLPEGAWNQMVLKALFVGIPLHPIHGLDERANPALARMLCEYAHERWSAGRAVSPELWRCVGPSADDAAMEDLARALASGEEPTRRAAALALRSCPHPDAPRLLEAHPVHLPEDLDWPDLVATP